MKINGSKKIRLDIAAISDKVTSTMSKDILKRAARWLCPKILRPYVQEHTVCKNIETEIRARHMHGLRSVLQTQGRCERNVQTEICTNIRSKSGQMYSSRDVCGSIITEIYR